MKFINVHEIRGLRKVETSGDFHFIINEEINLYVKEDKITSLVILDKIKPPFDLYFENEDILYKENTISSIHDFEIIINSESFSYFSVNNKRSNFALKGKFLGSEKIESKDSYYSVLINQECVSSGKIEECLKFISIDNNKIGSDNIMNDFIEKLGIKVLK
jgi:hypothetical protein